MRLEEYIVLDLETTGLSSEQGDRIIEVAAIKVRRRTIVEEFVTCINPGVPLKPVITAITGITEDEVRDAPDFEEVRERLEHFIGDLPIIGHNIGFDITFLKAYGLPLSRNVAIDTFVLATTFLPLQPSYALEILSHALGLTQGTHRALDDVKACNDLLCYMMDRFAECPDWVRRTVASVVHRAEHPYQILFEKSEVSQSLLEQEVAQYQPVFDRTFYLPAGEEERCARLQALQQEGGLQVVEYPLGEDYVIDALHGMAGSPELQVGVFQSEAKLQAFLQKYALPQEGRIPTQGMIYRPRESFLSVPRFLLLLQKSSLSQLEGMLYAKILIAMGQGSFDGTQYSVKLVHEEYGLWSLMALSPEEPSLLYDRYLDELSSSAVSLSTHGVYCSGLATFPGRTVHLFQGQHFPKSVSYGARSELTLAQLLGIVGWVRMLSPWISEISEEEIERFEARCDIVFGSLGVWFANVGASQVDYNTIDLLPHLKENQYFAAVLAGVQKIIHALEGFVERLETAGELFLPFLQSEIVKLQDMHRVFSEHDGQVTTLIQTQGDSHLSFVWFSEELHRACQNWARTHSVLCYTYGGAVTPRRGEDHFALFPAFWGKSDLYPRVFHRRGEKRGLIIVPSDLPDPNNPQFFRESSKLLISIFQYFGGQVIGSFASGHGLERIFHYVYPLMKAEGIHLYIEGMSGSFGKIVYQYQRNEAHSVLLGNNMLLEKIDLEELHLEGVIIQKLPFGMLPRGLAMTTSAQGFMEYSFPAMLMQLRGMLSQALHNPHERTVFFLLDNRLISSRYGQEVERLLSDDMEIMQIPMKHIPATLEDWGSGNLGERKL